MMMPGTPRWGSSKAHAPGDVLNARPQARTSLRDSAHWSRQRRSKGTTGLSRQGSKNRRAESQRDGLTQWLVRKSQPKMNDNNPKARFEEPPRKVPEGRPDPMAGAQEPASKGTTATPRQGSKNRREKSQRDGLTQWLVHKSQPKKGRPQPQGRFEEPPCRVPEGRPDPMAGSQEPAPKGTTTTPRQGSKNRRTKSQRDGLTQWLVRKSQPKMNDNNIKARFEEPPRKVPEGRPDPMAGSQEPAQNERQQPQGKVRRTAAKSPRGTA